ncbi:MAG TPA: multicopper oxidase domain-containing protein [Chloroflexota bacterium]|nr:multicopper oxidase domain-containing protein [Chloroflexota bacterium]
MRVSLPLSQRVAAGQGREALLLAALLAYGVVGWELVVHAGLGGAHGASLAASREPLARLLVRWLHYSALAFPLALGAVGVGGWLAARLGWRTLRPAHLVLRAMLIALSFACLLAPVGALFAATGPAAGAVSLPLAAGHGLLDAVVGLVLAMPLATLVLFARRARAPAWLSRLAPARPAGHRLGQALGGLAVALPVLALLTSFASAGQPSGGQTRTYYLAAEEVDWNYAPSDINQITGRPYSKEARVFVEGGETRIGRVYRKALFREYTDASFTTRKPVPPEWEHLGALGPPIYAAVGDTIEVVFKNNTQYPFSIHPHGVFYTKAHEGAPYNDGLSAAEKPGAVVPPGGVHTYVWQVPERAGPGPHDPSSILWMYHSHVGEVTDTNTGLIGPLIVTRRDAARPDGRPADVDREFIVLFNIYDENLSLYLDYNIRTFTTRPQRVKKDDEEFKESNLKHTINGFLYGTLPGLTMKVGERVRWYVFALGTESGLHTPHWHGQTVLWRGMRTDTISLLPMTMEVVDMVPDDPGTWLFHCSVNDHIIGGMQALFTVVP